jgi:hypothetical protein
MTHPISVFFGNGTLSFTIGANGRISLITSIRDQIKVAEKAQERNEEKKEDKK